MTSGSFRQVIHYTGHLYQWFLVGNVTCIKVHICCLRTTYSFEIGLQSGLTELMQNAVSIIMELDWNKLTKNIL